METFLVNEDVESIFRYVDARLKVFSNHPLASEVIEWSVDLWKTVGTWPFKVNLSKGIIKFIEVPRLVGIKGILSQCVPLNTNELKDLKRVFAYLSRNDEKSFLVKYRQFIKRRAFTECSRWETLNDLAPIWFGTTKRRFFPFRKSLWRKIAGFLVREIESLGYECSNIQYWNGYTHSTIKWFDCLIYKVCEEAKYVRKFCEEVSIRTGKVVLSWHNATLGAMGGWGFDGPVCLFEDVNVLNGLSRKVENLWKYYEQRFKEEGDFESIWHLFYKRLIEPKIKFSRFVDANIQKIFGDDLLNLYCNDLSNYYFPVNAAYWQNMSLGDVTKWADEVKACWLKGWSLLWALIDIASSYIASGKLDGMILPRIDKFFASTLRTKDVTYLTNITTKILQDHGDKVVILLWDDTSHSSNPSLQLTINRFKQYGIPVKGLGIYDKGYVSRSPTVDDVVMLYRETASRIFILRPFEGLYRSFDRMLKQRDFSFLANYVSSWRDGLAFVYAGTRTFPFLSIQTVLEEFSPWVIADRNRCFMGCFLQEKISCKLSNSNSTIECKSDLWRRISLFYKIWANL